MVFHPLGFSYETMLHSLPIVVANPLESNIGRSCHTGSLLTHRSIGCIIQIQAICVTKLHLIDTDLFDGK